MVKDTIIEELFEFYEGRFQKYITSERVTNISDEIISKTNNINNLLLDEQQTLLQEILELEHERLSLVEQESFTYGFILGIKLYREIEQLVAKI